MGNDGERDMNKFFRKKCFILAFLLMLMTNLEYTYAEVKWVTIEEEHVVLDSLNGVDAVYTKENNDPADSTYSCAAYVKKYYQQIYGVTVTNLYNEGPPLLSESGVGFLKVDEPKVGDIIFWPESTNGNNHSAIVKKVIGNTITLIEQNYKTGVVAAVGRTVTYPSDKFQIFRLTGQFTEKVPEVVEDGIEVGNSNNDEEIMIFVDSNSIPMLCDEFNFGTIVNVEGNGDNTNYKVDEDLHYKSYELNGSTKFSFTLFDENIEGWYLNEKKDEWEKIENGDSAVARRAFFTIKMPENNQNLTVESSVIEAPITEIGDSPLVLDEPVLDNTIPIGQLNSGNSNFYGFTDVDGSHWAYNSIQRSVQLGIFSGYDDGAFLPDKTITRAELAVLIANAAKADLSDNVQSSFKDVSDDDWYCKYVEFGKTYLKGDGFYFRPNELATREEVCVAVIEILKLDGLTSDTSILNTLVDRNTISEEAQEAVAFAINIGLISGYDDGTFRGNEPLTRAQAAVIFSKVY